MSRFVNFSLTKRTDELLRPTEKILLAEFDSPTNQKLVFKTVQSEIDPRASFRGVMDHMRVVFRSSIAHDTLPSVDEMNDAVYRKVSSEIESSRLNQERFVNRVYENSNVPTSFLPRPSMTLERDEDDEARGKYTIEFTR